MKKSRLYGYLMAIILILNSCSQTNNKGQKNDSGIVNTVEEFNKAITQAKPGDEIILSNGIWTDAHFVIATEGTIKKPITIKAQEKGKVILSGNTSLKIGGKHIIIKGLVFADGYTEEDALIIFKTDDGKLAENCRLTEIAIDHFNPTNRFDKSEWIHLHGKNNRVDHNYFGGKLNAGVTLVVKLNNKNSLENYHRIDHNHFGYRPNLGSNGGETLRVGVSTYSLSPSRTLIENNYFEQCDGEVEIVSLKSSDNIVRNNVFYESAGVLALRHGNRNLIENNFFIGNNKPGTGGVRVINEGHTIKNNHFQELKGKRFFGALPVMNGVPNSLINRYHRAENTDIIGNKFLKCDHIQFGVGADNERTDPPQHIRFTNNTFYHPTRKQVFEAISDYSTFSFTENTVVSSDISFSHKGFKKSEITFSKDPKDGLLKNESYQPELPITKHEVGPNWYTPKSKYYEINTEDPNIIKVTTNNNGALHNAIKQAKSGDIIELTSGTYVFSEPLVLNTSITINATDPEKPTIFKYEKNESQLPLVVIENGGSLRIKGVIFDGASDNGIAFAGISTSNKPMIAHYKLKVESCEFKNFDASRKTAFRAFKNTYADTLSFKNCKFQKISGNAISLDGENDARGRYNAEYVNIDNCHFQKVMGNAISLLRMGNDESTTGPFLELTNSTFIDVNNKDLGSVVLLWGVQKLNIDNLLFINSGKGGRAIKYEDPGWAISKIDNISLINSGRIETFGERTGSNIQIVKTESPMAYSAKYTGYTTVE
ncbi:chondroitinase-B domain-containing protein [Aquimarina sp. 2201CG14-23]|uniref:chondroitinase-B domain-containing protein n=1 Tax=Aquimarina mycalae TaxID=3040073 RepID=UPI002477DB24|nr:chondroitinase-B domain-containing protein [Aquimarina sp. 2201CG14-23]MDH7444855.1 chondroitinase-B domain-containing protein [Aquimarina sp. 2201CG14-23]